MKTTSNLTVSQFLRYAAAAVAVSALPSTTQASLLWAPMWDIRSLPMTWEVKATGSSMTFNSFIDGGGSFRVTTEDGSTTLATVGGGGDISTGPIAVTPGSIYRMVYESGFHVRPNWDGAEWARLGPGSQAAGPGATTGFQSDAELGFDSRWASLSSKFADTTWSINVASGEHPSLSVEHMTGDATGASKFEWISPSGVKTVADPDGLPGTGGAHFVARGGDLFSPPDPSSPQWDEYSTPTTEAGWWGFKLTAKDGTLDPYAWHYVLDRTDAGADQYLYLRPGAILDPNHTVPDSGGTVVLMGVGLVGLMGVARRVRRS